MNADTAPVDRTGHRRSVAARTEWPTVAVGVVIIALFAATTLAHQHLPAWLVVAALAVESGWWSSFQHELLHGHPFRDQRVNNAIGQFTIGLWVPYSVYRSTHLLHHRDELLTDPYQDPESFYVNGERWQRSNAAVRALLWTNRTLLGRLLIGPPIGIARFVRNEVRRIAAGTESVRSIWAGHALSAAVTCGWVFGIAKVPVWQYVLGATWAGTSVIYLRSFAEHRWIADGNTRSAIVDGTFPFGLLFLNNNLHDAHHARPSVAWYRLPALAEQLDSRTSAASGAGHYIGYREVALRYLVRPMCIPVHPTEPEASSIRLRQRPSRVVSD